MPADHFNLGRRDPNLARKERAQLGICFASLRRCGDFHLQGAIRQLARDFGFRTLRGHLDAERRRRPLADALLQEFMHGLRAWESGANPRPVWAPEYGYVPLCSGPLGPSDLPRFDRRPIRKRRRLQGPRIPGRPGPPMQ